MWKSKGLFDEVIKLPTTSDNSLTPKLALCTKIRVKFNKSCLNQNKIMYSHAKIVTMSNVYEINKSYRISTYPTLENCLFGTVSLTKNINDIDKYKYPVYGIGFNRKGTFPVGNGLGRNCIIFVVDMRFFCTC